MATVKYSRQRESIKAYLAATNEHPTADMVYMNVKRLHPNISLGTVYRNLNFLVSQKEAAKLTFGDGLEHYDGNMKPHYHFVCQSCKRVSDLWMPPLEHINVLAGAGFDGMVEGHSVIFYGKCAGCMERNG